MTTTSIKVGGVWVELIDDGDAIVRMTNNKKEWEPETRNIWRSLVQAGEGMIDVGAYTGVYAIASALIGAKVIALEPNPINYKRMRQNAAINSVKLFLHEAAASGRKGSASLFVKRVDAICDIGSLDTVMRDHIRVATVRIDDLPLPKRVAMIKIDTEGHEAEVIRGAMKTICADRPLILAELLTEADAVRVGAVMAMVGYKQQYVFDRRNYLFSMDGDYRGEVK